MNKKFVLIIGIFLIFGAGFLFADESKASSPMDIGEEIMELTNLICPSCPPGEISGKEIVLNVEEGISTVTFPGENDYFKRVGEIKIGENTFSYIASKKDQESYLKLDSSGEIIEMDLTIGTRNQKITFPSGDIVSLKPGDRIIYKEGSPPEIIFGSRDDVFTDLSEWKSGELKLTGNKFKYWKDGGAKIFDYGNEVYFDGNNFYFKEGNLISHKGIDYLVPEGKKIGLFTDGGVHEGNYISFGKNNFVIGAGDDPTIWDGFEIDSQSDYYLNLLKNTEGDVLRTKSKSLNGLEDLDFGSRLVGKRSLKMSLTEGNSYIDFGGQQNVIEPSLPTIFASNGYEIETGKLHIKSIGGKTEYLKSDGIINGALDVMIIDESNDIYDKALQVGENSNLLVNFKYKNSNWRTFARGDRDTILALNKLQERSVFYRPIGDEKLRMDFENLKDSLSMRANKLDEAFLKIDPNLKDYVGKDSLDVSFEDIDSEVFKRALNSDQMAQILGGTQEVEKFWKDLELSREMGLFKDSKGVNEINSLEYYGVRTSKSIRDLEDVSAMWTEAAKWIVSHSRGKYKLGMGSIGISSDV